jgi:two-component system cell cycle response regulator DivK
MDKQVLYIEDNADNRRLVQKALLSKGYEVILAEDGTTGWEMIQTYNPKVILLDISLPGKMDGLEVAARTKNMVGANQPWIIAVTASTMVGDREHFLNNGCDDYMAKPISVRKLISKVNEIFNRRN